MKRGFSFSNRLAYTFILLGILVVVAIGVNAFNSGGPPSTIGHSVEELDLGPLTIDDANNRIGVNTLNPQKELDVNGVALIDALVLGQLSLCDGAVFNWNSGSNRLELDTVGNCGGLNIYSSGTICDSNGCIGGGSSSGGGDSDWIISGSNQYSAVSGNVGIGTSSPSAKLDVVGNVEFNGVLGTRRSYTTYYLEATTSPDSLSLGAHDMCWLSAKAGSSYNTGEACLVKVGDSTPDFTVGPLESMSFNPGVRPDWYLIATYNGPAGADCRAVCVNFG